MSDAPDRLVPLTRMRKSIVNSMTQSAAVPQFTIEFEVDLSALSGIRAELNDRRLNIGYSDVVIAASARGLRAHPRLNASFTPEGIVEHVRTNVGFAIHLPDGLIAPAIMDADVHSLSEIASERRRLAAAATAGTLTLDEVLNTTFTISNLGTVGVRRFRALVVPPQAAILAVATVTPTRQVSLSLSCDHRVVDGMPAALFLRDVRDHLEAPDWILAAL